MPCYHPIKGYYGRVVNPETGKRPVVFSSREGYNDLRVSVPCGRCIGCRVDRSRQWAVRCFHEASLHQENCFITLTFDDKKLHLLRSYKYTKHDSDIDIFRRSTYLYKSDFVAFIKRLRKEFYGNSKGDVRYFHCGEYGEKFRRAHHHACLFGFNFPDRVLFQVKDGVRLYRSRILEELWPFGFCTIGDVTFESAAYIARYVVKKITGELAGSHYQGRLPEYITMSRRPGIGKVWLDKFQGDLYPKDFVVIRGRKYKIPKYYDRCYEATNPDDYGRIKAERVCRSRDNPDNTPERLAVREEVQKANLKLLKRGFENGE